MDREIKKIGKLFQICAILKRQNSIQHAQRVEKDAAMFCARTFFAASCFDNYKGLKFNLFLKFYAMFPKYFVGTTYQGLTRKVFTFPEALATPAVQAATNFNPPMLSRCLDSIDSEVFDKQQTR